MLFYMLQSIDSKGRETCGLWSQGLFFVQKFGALSYLKNVLILQKARRCVLHLSMYWVPEQTLCWSRHIETNCCWVVLREHLSPRKWQQVIEPQTTTACSKASVPLKWILHVPTLWVSSGFGMTHWLAVFGSDSSWKLSAWRKLRKLRQPGWTVFCLFFLLRQLCLGVRDRRL